MAAKKKTRQAGKRQPKITDSEAERGVVYVLSNPAMPDLVKIGHVKTVQGVKSRMSQLYGTGVPVPFKCEFAMRVAGAEKLERRLHRLFRGARINLKREFFRVDPEELSSFLLDCGHGEEVTLASDTPIKGVGRVDVDAGKRLAKKRPNMYLSNLNIPDGAILVSRKAGTDPEKCEVVNAQENLVRFRGEVRSFVEATIMILGEPKWSVTSRVYCTLYWEYNGKRLRDIYDEKYRRDDDED